MNSEIEAVLRQHPDVADACIGADAIYVVPRDHSADDRVSGWQDLFEGTYEWGAEAGEADFNIVGWHSSFTGEPLPDAEMRVWVESTVDRVLAHKPRRVLEIGCGTGLLLSRIAPRTSAYWATDFSSAALDYVRRNVVPGVPSDVRLLHRQANDFRGLHDESFDVVVLNSVVQYFPDVRYLRQVITEAVALLRPGGTVFLGDLRPLRLQEAFCAEVELARAEPGLIVAQLRERMHQRAEQEQELVVDPELFSLLRAEIPAITDVEVMLKRGAYRNELSQYRYDVVLHVGGAASAPRPAVVEWAGDFDAVEIPAEGLVIDNVPNARLSSINAWLVALKNARGSAQVDALRPVQQDGIDPEDWWGLARSRGFEADIAWSGDNGRYRVALRPAGSARWAQEVSPARSVHQHVNNPLLAQVGPRISERIRGYLQETLPQHEIPASVVVLPELPAVIG
ncbi:methyltransferase [Lentzea sp. NPDC004782]|uniref:methyltransferase n=1 Tax=Lentzea sp. NPDC004782 TaxID=3154458 RepID=UPI0033A17E6F